MTYVWKKIRDGNRAVETCQVWNYKAIRFWNNQILNDIEDAIRAIDMELQEY